MDFDRNGGTRVASDGAHRYESTGDRITGRRVDLGYEL
jgi:hypothetical protein